MDAGGIVAALEYAADVQAVVVAKPSPGIFEVALEVCGGRGLTGGDGGGRSAQRPGAGRGAGDAHLPGAHRQGLGLHAQPGEVTYDVADLAAFAALLLS